MIKRLFIANRGEIACRIIRTAHRLGVETIVGYSSADEHALATQLATHSVWLGDAAAHDSYLAADKVLQAAIDNQADAIHPGYGFLSENPEFVEAVEAAGIRFVGPPAAAVRAMGLKDAAKQRMQEAGVPVVPGYQGEDQTPSVLHKHADAMGYPLLIKARSGGGGKGLRRVNSSTDFLEQLTSAVREAEAAFADPVVLLEKFISSPRHIEVQVFGDQHGEVVHLFERDCTLQRRHQKVIEEAPAPDMPPSVRQAMTAAAVQAAKAISYTNAGTVEFIVDGSGPLTEDGFWFMEMNTRLQVEHPVTEAITGLDLVEWQLRVASGEPLPLTQDDIHMHGHAVEARVYAESPANDFLPAAGQLQSVQFSQNARVDTGVQTGDSITPFYDPMIAKVITHGSTRSEAFTSMYNALAQTHIAGTPTNVSFLSNLVQHETVLNASMDTEFIGREVNALITPVDADAIDQLLAAYLVLHNARHTKTGFRLWGAATHAVTLLIDSNQCTYWLTHHRDESISLSPDRASASYDVTLTITQVQDGQILYTHDGVRSQALYAVWRTPRTAQTQVSIKRTQDNVVFTHVVAGSQTNQSATNSDTVAAPMTGVVRQVLVSAGDTVQAGDTLLVMEAMKMETSLASPRDATVQRLHCAEGDAVQDGDVLVQFDALDNAQDDS